VSRDGEIARALRPTFAREAAALSTHLTEAFASGRRDDVRALAHRLVGTAGTVDETAVVVASRTLEALAADQGAEEEDVRAAVDAVVGAVLAAVSAIDAEASAGGEHRPAPLGGLPVVVAIEDNPANVTLLQRIFAGIDGVELVTAQSGMEGVRLARDRDAALVLLDMNLPDVPGEWVLDALRGVDGRPVTQIVVVSADASPGQEEHARSLGASDYVAKPFDIARLRTLVREACAVGV
jgi:CheY-like chemotaxis protein/HPt (histidine-containing phosphotransfer) domain-containing protein